MEEEGRRKVTEIDLPQSLTAHKAVDMRATGPFINCYSRRLGDWDDDGGLKGWWDTDMSKRQVEGHITQQMREKSKQVGAGLFSQCLM